MIEIFTQALFAIVASQAVPTKLQHMAGYQDHIALFMAICAQVDFKGFVIRGVAIITGEGDASVSLSMSIKREFERIVRKKSRVNIYQHSVLSAMLMVASAAWLGWVFGQDSAM
ncbi:MAG: hypothetical protein CVU44_07600 [Chloroflexi bacterium HGW-Chloroflexi-6]|nr:MAG: hypothetical protein CVU44_07600 [Chloroflexi bacterium HGW-Chloroflexi-6]